MSYHHDAVKHVVDREQDMLQKLAQLKAELKDTAEQLLAKQELAAHLQAAIDAYDAQVLAPLARRLTDAEDTSAVLLQQNKQAQDLQQKATSDLRAEQLQLLQEHHQLLDALSAKERQVGGQAGMP